MRRKLPSLLKSIEATFVILSLTAGVWAAPEKGLQLATFSCDITPPLGHPLCGGWIKPLVGVDDPELAKGVVLQDAGGVYVLCVLDSSMNLIIFLVNPIHRGRCHETS